MIIYGLLVTLATWAALVSVGEATARVLFGTRCDLITSATRLPLGVAAAVCFLETVGYFLPIRVAAWFLVAPVGYGAVRILRKHASRVDSWKRSIALASLIALAVGLAPVIIAHRFTAAALTNNDATYYITAADWLARVPWAFEYPSWGSVPPSSCLLELVLHVWHWRTGTPNLIAAVSSVSGLESTQGLTVVTAVLFACVPCAAIGIARSLGVSRGGPRELVVGLVAAFAAAPAFLAFQHMTGHLGAYALFPPAAAAMTSVVRHGGLRRAVYVAVLFGAIVALFADGAGVLVLIIVVAFVSGGRRVVRSAARVGYVGASTALLAPFTLMRAVHAAWNTVAIRLPGPKTIFPQRGWLPRGALDHLATTTGVDPWPPWPSAWPPSVQTAIIWLGAVAGAGLFSYGALRLRSRHESRLFAVLFGMAVFAGAVLTSVYYLRGKILLTAAAFMVPFCGIGAADLLGRPGRKRLLIVPYFVAELAGLSDLMRPSHFKVVDKPAHAALLSELRRVPAGSLIAFDGLGAPSDVVLDSQRAHRAALLSGLRPVQPGLDGGFYLPACPDAPRPDPMPRRAYALQRVTSETLTRGTTLSQWDQFRLASVDLEAPDAFIAAWAPTHGWMAAEHDPDGRIFRWAEWQAHGTLHAVGPAPCGRLRGEMRVVRAAALVDVKVFDASVFSGQVTANWTAFETRAFADGDPVVVDFSVIEAAARPPDPTHALAVSRLALEPAWQCGATVRTGDDGGTEAAYPIEFDQTVDLSILPDALAPCSDVSIVVDGGRFASVGLRVDGGPTAWRYMNTPAETIGGVLVGTTGLHHVVVETKGGAEHQRWRIAGVVVKPRSCPK